MASLSPESGIPTCFSDYPLIIMFYERERRLGNGGCKESGPKLVEPSVPKLGIFYPCSLSPPYPLQRALYRAAPHIPPTGHSHRAKMKKRETAPRLNLVSVGLCITLLFLISYFLSPSSPSSTQLDLLHPTWCQFDATWVEGEGCMCDISSSPLRCSPEESSAILLFPSDRNPLQLSSVQQQTFRVQLRTAIGTPVFSSDVKFGESRGVKSVAARIEGDHEVFLLEDPVMIRWGTWEVSRKSVCNSLY